MARQPRARHATGHGFEPDRALEPPVAEELGVVGRGHDRLTVDAFAGEGVGDQLHEVIGVRLHLFHRGPRLVHLLLSEIAARVRDAPEPEAAGEVLLVEFEIVVLTGIAVLAAPDLHSGLRIAEERHRRAGAPARGDPRRQIEGSRLLGRLAFVRQRLRAERLERQIVPVEEEGQAAGDQVRVRDEVFEAVLRQQLLDPGPHPPRAVSSGRRRPLVPRPVRAFRQPDAARRPGEVTEVRLDGGAELEVNRFVTREEGEVPMSGGARDDLHVAPALELGERPGNVAPDAAMELPHPLVELLPEVRQLHDVPLAFAHGVLAGVDARAADVVVVKRDLLLEFR